MTMELPFGGGGAQLLCSRRVEKTLRISQKCDENTDKGNGVRPIRSGPTLAPWYNACLLRRSCFLMQSYLPEHDGRVSQALLHPDALQLGELWALPQSHLLLVAKRFVAADKAGLQKKTKK